MLKLQRLLAGFGALFALSQLAAGTAIAPVDLSNGANTTFADEVANDRKGGWIDLGANDMRVLKPGEQSLGGIPFLIRSDKAGKGKSCIVVSGSSAHDYIPAEATLQLSSPAKGKTLYLLHAASYVTPEHKLIGRLTVEYTDGTDSQWHIRIGENVADWEANTGAPNAARVWSMYNNTSQVSLYASKFDLSGAPVKSIRFNSGEDSVWMVAAASIGDSVTPTPIYETKTLQKDYPAPAVPNAGALAKLPRTGTPKNIIFIIGDGMGQGVNTYASLYAHGAPEKLVVNQLPVRGMALTYSANAAVTDSAASGTALSGGYKTNNGFVGMTPEKQAIRSIAEEARDSGRSVGIMTTDYLTGATPAVFMAHVPSRGMAQEIAAWEGKSGFNLMIGRGIKPFLPEAKGGSRTDGIDVVAELQGKGYVQISDLAAFEKAPAKPVFGFIENWLDDTTLLSKFATEAFNRLATNPKGFFIMIEGCDPDHGGHANNPDLSINGALMVDFTVKAALDFAQKNRDTLVVVTADHETGGVHAAPNPANPKRPFVYYTTHSHTGSPVNVFAFGPGSDNFSGVINNIEIPAAMAKLWKLPLNQPVEK